MEAWSLNHWTAREVPREALKFQDTDRLKVKEWKKIYYVNGKHNRAGIAILLSARENIPGTLLETKTTFPNDKGVNDTTITNTYDSNKRTSKQMKQN